MELNYQLHLCPFNSNTQFRVRGVYAQPVYACALIVHRWIYTPHKDYDGTINLDISCGKVQKHQPSRNSIFFSWQKDLDSKKEAADCFVQTIPRLQHIFQCQLQCNFQATKECQEKSCCRCSCWATALCKTVHLGQLYPCFTPDTQ